MSGATISTPLDLILMALKLTGTLGVGQAADPSDTNDALQLLNAMIGQWNRQRTLVWHAIDVACTSTGAESYTLGPGGDFNTPRTDKILSAYARLLPVQASQPVDFQLYVMPSREDYSDIMLKNLTAFTSSVYYDPAYPMGNCFFWPLGTNSQFEYHVVIKDTIGQFTSLAQTIVLPQEYIAPLLWNLAVELAPLYQYTPNAITVGKAKVTLNVLRTANAQVPTMQLAGVPGMRRGGDITLGNYNGLPWGI